MSAAKTTELSRSLGAALLDQCVSPFVRANTVPRRWRLASDAVMASSSRSTNLVNFGSDSFVEGLDVLANALRTEGGLTAEGFLEARKSIVTALENRLHGVANEIAKPGTLEVPIERPIFIVSQPRSGSTMLHRLLMSHPTFRGLRYWEVRYPVERLDGSLSQEAMIDIVQRQQDQQYEKVPALRRAHYRDAMMFEECHHLWEPTFLSANFIGRYRVPSYQAWFRTQDMTTSYRYHRRQLQHILARRSEVSAAQLVLKSPWYLWNLRELLSVYPDARVLLIHRDPADAVPSFCSLRSSELLVRGARTVNLQEIGSQYVDWLRDAQRSLANFKSIARPGSYIEMMYSDLLASPLVTLDKVLEFLNVEKTAESGSKARMWLEQNKQGQHGEHRYTLATYGLGPDDLRDLSGVAGR